MYFSGIPWMQEFVAPRANREFGALENLENLILLAMLWVACAGVARKRERVERALLGVAAALILLVLLEEIDYGWHYFELWTGTRSPEGTFRNLHNIGKAHHPIHTFGIVLAVLCFGLFPLLGARTRIAVTRYRPPHVLYVATLASMIVVGQAVRLLNRVVETNQSLKGNLTEFEEVYIYYIFFLYLCELVYFRTHAASDSTGGSPTPVGLHEPRAEGPR
jgi:hypothetical protein